jgi:hypothetical protein
LTKAIPICGTHSSVTFEVANDGHQIPKRPWVKKLKSDSQRNNEVFKTLPLNFSAVFQLNTLRY